MKRHSKKTGFTFIELMAVLSIIALLVGIFFVNSQIFVEKARDARVKKQLDSLRQSVEVYKTDHQGRVPEAVNLLYPDYINELDLAWQGSRGEGVIGYDPAEGYFNLIVERGEAVDSSGVAYSDY